MYSEKKKIEGIAKKKEVNVQPWEPKRNLSNSGSMHLLFKGLKSNTPFQWDIPELQS